GVPKDLKPSSAWEVEISEIFCRCSITAPPVTPISVCSVGPAVPAAAAGFTPPRTIPAAAVSASQAFVRTFMEFFSVLVRAAESHGRHAPEPSAAVWPFTPASALSTALWGSSILTFRHDSSLVTNRFLYNETVTQLTLGFNLTHIREV